MHFKIAVALLALSGLSATDESIDENDLEARQLAGPGCYCCSGYIVQNVAGTRCGSSKPTCLSGYLTMSAKVSQREITVMFLMSFAAPREPLSGLRLSVYFLLTLPSCFSSAY